MVIKPPAIAAIAAVALLLGGCVEAAPTPPVLDAAAGPCAASTTGAAPGEWLIGRWTHPYNVLQIRRQGAALVYAWERHPGLRTKRWGEKAAAKGRGQVTRLAGCAVEMKGLYVESASEAMVGREMFFKLSLLESNMMRGQWYGAGRIWLEVSWRKE